MKHFFAIGAAALLLIYARAPHAVASGNTAIIGMQPSQADEVHGMVSAGANAAAPASLESVGCRASVRGCSSPSTTDGKDVSYTVGGAAEPVSDQEPKITILRPREGESFKDAPIVVEVSVENFELAPPIPYFGPPNPKPLGHIHYFLDNYPEVATSSTQIMFGKKEGERYLRAGQHILYAELVHDNHDNLAPRVWKRVAFNVSH